MLYHSHFQNSLSLNSYLSAHFRSEQLNNEINYNGKTKTNIVYISKFTLNITYNYLRDANTRQSYAGLNLAVTNNYNTLINVLCVLDHVFFLHLTNDPITFMATFAQF